MIDAGSRLVIWSNAEGGVWHAVQTCLPDCPSRRVKGISPTSLDWPITTEQKVWASPCCKPSPRWTRIQYGVASPQFMPTTPPAKEQRLYRQLSHAVLEAVERFQLSRIRAPGCWPCQCSTCGESDRAIDWSRDLMSTIVRKSCAADSAPGVLSSLLGVEASYGAHEEERPKGSPRKSCPTRRRAIRIGAVDGAVWISHSKLPRTMRARIHFAEWLRWRGCDRCAEEFCSIAGIKLPATQVLGPLLRGALR